MSEQLKTHRAMLLIDNPKLLSVLPESGLLLANDPVDVVFADEAIAAIAAKDARIAELEGLLEHVQEGSEILQSLIDNIEAKGNYSAESTVNFLRQAHSCLLPAFSGQQQAEPLIDTSAWQSCNPGCDPEFNGEKSRHCSCEPAKAAIAKQQAEPKPLSQFVAECEARDPQMMAEAREWAKTVAPLAATPSEDGQGKPVAYMLADAVGGSALEFQEQELLQLQNRYGGEIVPLYAQPARQVGGDERCKFEAWARDEFEIPQDEDVNWSNMRVASALRGWQARASLAPAAVVMPEYERNHAGLVAESALSPWNAALDEVARLNRRAIPVVLLERIIAHLEWDGTEPMTTIQFAYKCDELAGELRALLGKDGE